MIKDLSTAGAMPALELMLRFAGARQRVLASNIANIDTPGYQPKDVSPRSFQEALGEAIDARRERNGGSGGSLAFKPTDEVRTGPGGALELAPKTASGSVLFHDRNDRDLERMMQAMVENATAFRVASDLLRQRTGMIRSAIAQRV